MITVTGATGHIGNVLVKKLLKQGEEVRVLVLPHEDLTPIEGLDVEIVEGDVRDLPSLFLAFEGVRMVYHLAGIITISPGDEDFVYQVNVVGTRNVVEACIQRGVTRLIYTSSVHALREPPEGKVIDESCAFYTDSQRGAYDRTKAQASTEVMKGIQRGLDAVIVAPSGVLGPCDYRISQLGHMILSFAKGDLPGYVEGAYDFVDVRDVAEGMILAALNGKSGEVYILSGERVTVDELMLKLQKITGKSPPRFKAPLWLAKSVGRWADLYHRISGAKPLITEYSADVLASNSLISCDKARRDLGYNTRSLEHSLEDSVQWFYENGHLNIDEVKSSGLY
jgi:dihydroflavonol-4-reductase